MRIEQIELKAVRLPLVRAFRTSSGSKDHVEHILVRIVAGGIVGWGECASPSDPFYGPETTETCWHILRDFLGPMVLGRDWETIDELVRLYHPVKGHHFAKAGLEMACWDALAHREGRPLADLLGGSRT
jgi:O-succinylbenzoate synthase